MKKKNYRQKKKPITSPPATTQQVSGTTPGAADNLMQKWMHAEDVMKLLRICPRTLYNYRCHNLLVASKTRGRILFEVAAMEAMLHKRMETFK